jgi:hypothetical protein
VGKARIGFYGGTFNPIHKGHIEVAKTAKRHLNLYERIIEESKPSLRTVTWTLGKEPVFRKPLASGVGYHYFIPFKRLESGDILGFYVFHKEGKKPRGRKQLTLKRTAFNDWEHVEHADVPKKTLRSLAGR